MAYYTRWSSGDELYHYGIPGQKWGQRRYQNPDGSLTAEGRARYGRIAERHYRAGRALNKFASAHKGSRVGNLAAKAGRRQVQIGNSYRNSKSQNARDKRLQTALKVGAGVAGAAALGYGAYRAAKYMKSPEYVSKMAARGRAQRLENTLTRSRLADGRGTLGDKAKLAGWKAQAGLHNAGQSAKSGLKKAGAAIGTSVRTAGTKISGAARNAGSKIKSTASGMYSNARNKMSANAEKRERANRLNNTLRRSRLASGRGTIADKAWLAGRRASYGAKTTARNVGAGVANAARNVGYAGLGLVSRKKRKK